MHELNILQMALAQVQGKTIGLFFPRMDPKTPHLVVEFDQGLIHCFTLGSLLGLQELHIAAIKGEYFPFPNGKSLAQMLENPMEFHKWYSHIAPE